MLEYTTREPLENALSQLFFTEDTVTTLDCLKMLEKNDFPCILQKHHKQTNGWMDQPTDGRSDPVIEMRGLIYKHCHFQP